MLSSGATSSRHYKMQQAFFAPTRVAEKYVSAHVIVLCVVDQRNSAGALRKGGWIKWVDVDLSRFKNKGSVQWLIAHLHATTLLFALNRNSPKIANISPAREHVFGKCSESVEFTVNKFSLVGDTQESRCCGVRTPDVLRFLGKRRSQKRTFSSHSPLV